MAFDTNLVGEWKHNSKNEELAFKAGGASFLGTSDIPFTLTNSSATLTINNITTYDRIGDNTGTIIGTWRNDADGEEVTFRSDGRVLTILDSEDFVRSGFFTVQNSKLSSNEFRSMCATNNNQIEFFPFHVATSSTMTYSVNGNTLTLGFDTYTKI